MIGVHGDSIGLIFLPLNLKVARPDDEECCKERIRDGFVRIIVTVASRLTSQDFVVIHLQELQYRLPLQTLLTLVDSELIETLEDLCKIV